MTLVIDSLIFIPTYHNVIIFILIHVTFILSLSFLFLMFVILSCFMSFFIMIVIMFVISRLNLLLLTSIFVRFISSVIIISKTILSKRLYYLLLTFVSHLTLFSFVIGLSFVRVSRIMGSCRVRWNIGPLIIRVAMSITFVTLFVWISIRISMLPLISITTHELIALSTFIGCVECSIYYK